MSDPIVIIGAGLAGLNCARTLQQQGVESIVYEASDGIGGRVRTDQLDGFLLDRGFQVLLTAYPEVSRQLDLDQLGMQCFEAGSLVLTDNGLQRFSDPWRQPKYLLQTALARVGSLSDKLRIGRLRSVARRLSIPEIFSRSEQSTQDELFRLGFSKAMIEKFFRPFLGGVFLDHELHTSSRMLYFVFKMFSEGPTALPAAGMGAIPQQLADRLPDDSIRLNSAVSSIERNHIRLASDKKIPFNKLVLATEQPAAGRLVPELASERAARSVDCVYFSAPEPPVPDRMLVLNGTQFGIVNNLCVPSQVAPAYSPEQRSLISATVLKSDLDRKDLHEHVRLELSGWFGNVVDSWKHLRTYTIPYALPNQTPPAFEPALKPARLRKDLYVCGDYRANGSINGAMQSGRLAAEELLKSL